jgi:biotin operon repressor
MSARATFWAWRVGKSFRLNSTELLVLLRLADGASEETGECWYKQESIALATCLSRSGVQKALYSLEKEGLVRIERVTHEGRTLANTYRVNMDLEAPLLTTDAPVPLSEEGIPGKHRRASDVSSLDPSLKTDPDSRRESAREGLPGTISIESMPDKKGKTKQIIIPAPPETIDSPELRSALSEFVHHRKKKGTPIDSERAWTLLYNRLKPVGRQHARLALLYAISQRWTGFDVDWLNGKSWATIASELGLSLEAEKPAPAPADLAARDLARAIHDAIPEIMKIAPAEDGWMSLSRSIFLDHLDTCKSESEVAEHLARCRAVCDRLRASGAYPLRRPTQPGEVLPAGGGARIVIDLRDGSICDTICPACGEGQNQGLCLCQDRDADLARRVSAECCPHGTTYCYPCEECDTAVIENQGFSSKELAAIDPPNPDFFNALSKLPPLDVSGFEPLEELETDPEPPHTAIVEPHVYVPHTSGGRETCHRCAQPRWAPCHSMGEIVVPPRVGPGDQGLRKTELQRAKVADGQHAYTHNALTGRCVWCQQAEDHIRHYLPQPLFGDTEKS